MPPDVPDRPARPLWALGFLLAAPLLAGTLLAPQAYRGILWLNQHVDLGHHFTAVKFYRVFTRCVMIAALLALYPAVRWSGVRRLDQLGWRRRPGRWAALGAGGALGAVSILAAYTAWTLAGALLWHPRSTSAGRLLAAWLPALAGAGIIGLLEEFFFRGYIFGALRGRLGFWRGALLASAFFAGIHLLRPGAPVDLDPTHWLAGFRLWPHATDRFQPVYVAPTMTTLFLMGVCLCLLYDALGDIYFVAGLHAGWVWGVQVGTFLCDRHPGRWELLFGPSETLFMTWAGAALTLLFVLGALLYRRRRAGPPAPGNPPEAG